MSFTPNTSLRDAIKQFVALIVAFPALYWIVTALRGPDDDAYSSSNIASKYPTTGRIRGFLYGDAVGIPGSKLSTSLTPEQIIARDDYLKTCSTRFATHYYKAVAAIQEAYGYDLMTETDLTKPAEPKVDAIRLDALKAAIAVAANDPGIFVILGALRSADSMNGSKSFTTARIRGFLSEKFGVQLSGALTTTPLTPAQQAERDRTLALEAQHYMCYYYEAVDEIKKIFGYDLLTETVVS